MGCDMTRNPGPSLDLGAMPALCRGMSTARHHGVPPEIRPLHLRDLGASCGAGLHGFGQVPVLSLACGLPFVIGVMLLPWAGAGLLVALAFLLPPVLGVLHERGVTALHERGLALLVLASLSAFACLLWLAGAWLIAAAFPGALVNWRWLVLPDRLLLAGAELSFLLIVLAVAGAALVMAVAMVVDHCSDPVTAVLHSISVVRDNLPVMALWAVICAALVVVAVMAGGLGLVVVVPLLGHGNAELARRALG